MTSTASSRCVKLHLVLFSLQVIGKMTINLECMLPASMTTASTLETSLNGLTSIDLI